MDEGSSTMSITTYLIVLLIVLGISIIALVIWFRHYVSPKITNIVNINPELPQLAIDEVSKPIPIKLEICLGVGAIIVYLAVRFIGLSNFPIYFFTDEAAQTVLAEQLVKSDFRIDDEFLPTYFWNSNKYSLSTSVYLQVIPYMLLGKSVLVTRGTSILITLLGAFSIGLIPSQIFRIRNWWLGIFILSITPAWFLHSRTAFETVIATTFYGGFMYAYLLYLYKSPKYLYLAIFAAAFTFYSYNPARLVILVTIGLLLLSDFHYHWQNRGVVGWGLLPVFLLAIPYLRFLIAISMKIGTIFY